MNIEIANAETFLTEHSMATSVLIKIVQFCNVIPHQPSRWNVRIECKPRERRDHPTRPDWLEWYVSFSDERKKEFLICAIQRARHESVEFHS